MNEKPVFLSRHGMLAVAVAVVVVIGTGIYWFNQSPALQETLKSFNPLQQPKGNESIQINQPDNPAGVTMPENPDEAGTNTSQTGSGANGSGTSQETPGQSNNNGNGGGSGGEDGGSGGGGDNGSGGGEEEVVIPGNCSDIEGRICDEGQTCDGTVLSTLDTDQCCFGKCV